MGAWPGAVHDATSSPLRCPDRTLPSTSTAFLLPRLPPTSRHLAKPQHQHSARDLIETTCDSSPEQGQSLRQSLLRSPHCNSTLTTNQHQPSSEQPSFTVLLACACTTTKTGGQTAAPGLEQNKDACLTSCRLRYSQTFLHALSGRGLMHI